MKTICVFLIAIFPAGYLRADDALAKKFLYHVPGQLRDFDPVEDALKQDGLKGKELKREAERIKIGMGHHGVHPNNKIQRGGGGQHQLAGTSVDKRAIRMARAAYRRSMVASSDASGFSAVNQDMAAYWSVVRASTPHY